MGRLLPREQRRGGRPDRRERRGEIDHPEGDLRPYPTEERGILFEGAPIHKTEPHRLIEAGIAHVPEARRLFAEMSVEENLDMGSLKGEAKKNRARMKESISAAFPPAG